MISCEFNSHWEQLYFLRHLDTKFIQKLQKYQICAIYENLDCVNLFTVRRGRDIPLWMPGIYVSGHNSGINAYYTAGQSKATQSYAPLKENVLGYLSTRMNPSLSL